MEKLQIQKFGITKDGSKPYLYKMKNDAGMEVQVSDFGATLVNVTVLDQDKNPVEVVLGYEDAAGYENGTAAIGAIVGRNANRIGGACVTINGIDYKLAENDGKNNLHSGPDVYQKRMWRVVENGDDHVTFLLHSPDGDQGYPGNAIVSVTYTLTDEDMLTLTYRVLSDADTPVNMTNHGYFNLLGNNGGSVLDHKARILADFYTPSDETSIPTGEVRPVKGTPMDFTDFHVIGDRIDENFDQLVMGHGYDHNWCLSHVRGDFGLAAQIFSDESGRAMDVYTDQPGVQFYTANWLDQEKGKKGAFYHARTAFCFETQNFPDAVNKPHFPSPIVKAGKEWTSATGYRFYIYEK